MASVPTVFLYFVMQSIHLPEGALWFQPVVYLTVFVWLVFLNLAEQRLSDSTTREWRGEQKYTREQQMVFQQCEWKVIASLRRGHSGASASLVTSSELTLCRGKFQPFCRLRKNEPYSNPAPSHKGTRRTRNKMARIASVLTLVRLFVSLLSYLPQCLVLPCFPSWLSFPTLLRNVRTNAEN